jgi:hypothetical protein
MYDSFDDCFYPAEQNYHEDMLMQEAEEFYRNFYGDDDQIPSEDDGNYDDLLDELDFPF